MEKFGLKRYLHCSGSLLTPGMLSAHCSSGSGGKYSLSNPSPSLGDPSPRDLGDALTTMAASGGVSLFSKPHGPHISPSHTPLPSVSQKPKYHHSARVTIENVKAQLTFGNPAQADAAELPPACRERPRRGV